MAERTHIARQEEAIYEAAVQIRPTDPATPFPNQIWLNTTENRLKRWTGTETIIVAQGKNSITPLMGSTVDWNQGDMFYIEVTANTTFTFNNAQNAQTITLVVNNTTGLDRIMTFPSMLNSADIVTRVRANTVSVFTFGRVNNTMFCVTPVRTESLYAP